MHNPMKIPDVTDKHHSTEKHLRVATYFRASTWQEEQGSNIGIVHCEH